MARESSSRAGKGLDEALQRDGDADPTKPVVDVEGRTLTLSLSNLDKVLYPETGFTKGQVIDYYVRIAPVLLPHVADRPLTMHRFPGGVDDPNSFYEKHRPKSAPAWVRSERVLASPKAKDQNGVDFVILDDLATMVWVANLASLELHVPQWRRCPICSSSTSTPANRPPSSSAPRWRSCWPARWPTSTGGPATPR